MTTLTDRLTIRDGDAILVVHADGTYTSYVIDRPRPNLADITVFGLGKFLDDRNRWQALVNRTVEYMNKVRDRLKKEAWPPFYNND